ncbi:hypothetical protein D3C85_1057400 [compost metagenome]
MSRWSASRVRMRSPPQVGQLCWVNITTHLVDPWADLEQPRMGAELGHAPEAGVDAVRRLVLVEEAVGVDVPDDLVVGVLDLALEGRHQATGDRLVVGAVGGRQLLQDGGILAGCKAAGDRRLFGGGCRVRQAGSNEASQQATVAQVETRHANSIFLSLLRAVRA